MKVVFDTNVVVAGIVAEGLCREILETHMPEHEAILASVLWDELVEKLRRKFGLAPDDAHPRTLSAARDVVRAGPPGRGGVP